MLTKERRNEIVNLVKTKGSVTIEELKKQFNVSRITIWKDLKILEEKGYLSQVHGGAMRLDRLNPDEEEFLKRRKISSKKKRRIAQFASENYVKDNEILFLDGGTTVLEMLPYLQYKNLTILTNGLFTLNSASNYLPELNVICVGGVLRKPSFTFVGDDSDYLINRYNVDKAFVSAFGVSLNNGFMDPNPLDMRVKKLICENSKEIIVLIDSDKYKKSSLTTFLPIEKAHKIITDSEIPPEFIENLRKLKIKYDIVDLD